MSDDQRPGADELQAGAETYIPPALEVLGTVEEVTQGPSPGVGDVPTGVISI